MIDYHTHTRLCRHASGDTEEYVKSAVAMGLTEIGISCHNPMPDGYDPSHRMEFEEFERIYKPEVLRLREKYAGSISVKFGLEADYFPGTEDYVRELTEKHEFDYIIGSVHYLGDDHRGTLIPVWVFDPGSAVERGIEYYARVRDMAFSGICDIIGHFDLLKKNGIRPESMTRELLDAIDQSLLAVKENGLSIEINTSGLRKKPAEVYPSDMILEKASEYGVPLTTGSDAHSPEDVAADFDTAYSLIRKYGGGNVCAYTRRRRTMVPAAEFSTKE